jgi:energy-converting hydrogenase B subunit D
MSALFVVDLTIALLLTALAARLLHTRRLFEATVLFIAFGLVLALAWVRLEAPDLALAEAALGAGVTGALLVNALRRLLRKGGEEALEDR